MPGSESTCPLAREQRQAEHGKHQASRRLVAGDLPRARRPRAHEELPTQGRGRRLGQRRAQRATPRSVDRSGSRQNHLRRLRPVVAGGAGASPHDGGSDRLAPSYSRVPDVRGTPRRFDQAERGAGMGSRDLGPALPRHRACRRPGSPVHLQCGRCATRSLPGARTSA